MLTPDDIQILCDIECDLRSANGGVENPEQLAKLQELIAKVDPLNLAPLEAAALAPLIQRPRVCNKPGAWDLPPPRPTPENLPRHWIDKLRRHAETDEVLSIVCTMLSSSMDARFLHGARVTCSDAINRLIDRGVW